MLEERGFSTVAIGSVRAQAEKTRPPRGLWTNRAGRPGLDRAGQAAERCRRTVDAKPKPFSNIEGSDDLNRPTERVMRDYRRYFLNERGHNLFPVPAEAEAE